MEEENGFVTTFSSAVGKNYSEREEMLGQEMTEDMVNPMYDVAVIEKKQ